MKAILFSTYNKQNKSNYNFRYLFGITIIGALGGLLFGYDWVVIGGAKPFYEVYFNISGNPAMQGWMMSSALLGCVIGALFSGFISDRFGRKAALFTAAILFTSSAVGTGAAGSIPVFILFRIWGGIGIGVASTVSPVFISEISPAPLRGRLVSLNQLTIVIGILLAQIVNWLIAKPVPENITTVSLLESWNGQTGWRWMFWAEVVPASVFFLLLFAIPESPRWLMKTGRDKQAIRILNKVSMGKETKEIYAEIKNSFGKSKKKAEIRILLSASILPVLGLGMVLAFYQQWCGINVVFNYAEEVFESAGFGVNDILFNIVITGIVNLVFTFVAIRTVDRWGRKKLLITGSLGLCLVYLLVGSSYYFNLNGLSVLVFILSGISIYAMTLAPVTWVVLSEIFPNHIRGAAMSVATSVLWIASFLLIILFPILNNALGAHGTFWLFAGFCLFGFLYIKKKLPETRGKTLEEIENEFKKD
ncbi:sugar porter family MFS transporter [Bacteroidota bacterium]